MPETSPPPTAVTIFGRTYHLRGDGDPGYMQELAQEVDRRMRDVAAATGTADTLKVAILAALNITDEFIQARRAGVTKDAGRRLGRLVALIDEALASGQGDRPIRAARDRAE